MSSPKLERLFEERARDQCGWNQCERRDYCPCLKWALEQAALKLGWGPKRLRAYARNNSEET